MSTLIDLTGKKFGKLTVLNRAQNTKNGKTQWLCQCECGNVIYMTSEGLKTKTVLPKSCGCISGRKTLDLTGQRFGKLVVLCRVQNKGKAVIWKCQCDCGNIFETRAENLRNGTSISCGCKRAEDLTGKKFDKLTVLSKSSQRKKKGKTNYILWLCQCECGNTIYKTSDELKRKTITPKSCGCIKRYSTKRAKDLIGQRFGKLVVLDRAQNKGKAVVWKCQCDCGKVIEVRAESLKRGTSISCGCSRIEDLTGQRFGKLVVLRMEYIKNRACWWKCKCDCGNEKLVSTNSLKSGVTKSCGCLKMSAGEKKIVKLLKEHNISFETQYVFDDLVLPSGYKARFDFYVNNQYIIEYDGHLHFGYRNNGWNTKEHFERLALNDSVKNQYCIDNKIPIIRIPYTHFNDLCIEDLQLETSNFIQDYVNKPQEEILT